MEYSKDVSNRIAREFVVGQSIGCIKKLKASAIRYLILEQLDRYLARADRETVLQLLLDINRDNWRKLASKRTEIKSPTELAIELKEKYPNMSSRDAEPIVGKTHTTICKWWNESFGKNNF